MPDLRRPRAKKEVWVSATPGIGAALRLARERIGVRQEDVAAALGRSVMFVSRLERGRRLRVRMSVLDVVCSTIGIGLGDVVHVCRECGTVLPRPTRRA